MPKPVYTSKIHSRLASRAAYDEVGDRVRVTKAQLANLRNTSIYPLSGLDMVLVEGMRSHSAAPCLTRKQSQLPSDFNNTHLRPIAYHSVLVCRTIWGFKFQMERMILKLGGNFLIPSQDPNEDLTTPLDILDSLDVDRLFIYEKWIFYDQEIRF